MVSEIKTNLGSFDDKLFRVGVTFQDNKLFVSIKKSHANVLHNVRMLEYRMHDKPTLGSKSI